MSYILQHIDAFVISFYFKLWSTYDLDVIIINVFKGYFYFELTDNTWVGHCQVVHYLMACSKQSSLYGYYRGHPTYPGNAWPLQYHISMDSC